MLITDWFLVAQKRLSDAGQVIENTRPDFNEWDFSGVPPMLKCRAAYGQLLEKPSLVYEAGVRIVDLCRPDVFRVHWGDYAPNGTQRSTGIK